jgi:hypothetical protein
VSTCLERLQCSLGAARADRRGCCCRCTGVARVVAERPRESGVGVDGCLSRATPVTAATKADASAAKPRRSRSALPSPLPQDRQRHSGCHQGTAARRRCSSVIVPVDCPLPRCESSSLRHRTRWTRLHRRTAHSRFRRRALSLRAAEEPRRRSCCGRAGGAVSVPG